MLSGKPNPLIQLILSLPNWLLPAQVKIVKETLRSKEYAKAFLEIMEVEEGNSCLRNIPIQILGVRQKSQRLMVTALPQE